MATGGAAAAAGGAAAGEAAVVEGRGAAAAEGRGGAVEGGGAVGRGAEAADAADAADAIAPISEPLLSDCDLVRRPPPCLLRSLCSKRSYSPTRSPAWSSWMGMHGPWPLNRAYADTAAFGNPLASPAASPFVRLARPMSFGNPCNPPTSMSCFYQRNAGTGKGGGGGEKGTRCVSNDLAYRD